MTTSKDNKHDTQNTPKNKRDKHEKNNNSDDDDHPDEQFDNEAFQEMLGEMFPSKHQKKKD